jgi:hypothetical protein
VERQEDVMIRTHRIATAAATACIALAAALGTAAALAPPPGNGGISASVKVRGGEYTLLPLYKPQAGHAQMARLRVL